MSHFPRFIPNIPLERTKESRREDSARIAADTETFLARGGKIQLCPPFATIELSPEGIELLRSTPISPGSSNHDPDVVLARARRRQRRYGYASLTQQDQGESV